MPKGSTSRARVQAEPVSQFTQFMQRTLAPVDTAERSPQPEAVEDVALRRAMVASWEAHKARYEEDQSARIRKSAGLGDLAMEDLLFMLAGDLHRRGLGIELPGNIVAHMRDRMANFRKQRAA